jgi:hypothetical protein
MRGPIVPVVLLGVAIALATPVAVGAASLQLPFVTHAAFFSQETHQAHPLDPQVFVREAQAPAATGPQAIDHVAGYRPARVADPPDMPLFTAAGRPLGFTLGAWLGARGTVTIVPAAGGTTVAARFTGLRPRGVYSPFENHFDQRPIGFSPLDGQGTKNSFVANADGTAAITVQTPAMLTSANAVLLVYHSDSETHGTSRGKIGVTAHHQLIAKVP